MNLAIHELGAALAVLEAAPLGAEPPVARVCHLTVTFRGGLPRVRPPGTHQDRCLAAKTGTLRWFQDLQRGKEVRPHGLSRYKDGLPLPLLSMWQGSQ